jgi:uncharacterized protein (DUF2249 family)
MEEHRIDVRDVPPAERHPQIHEAFEAVPPGGSLTLVNDHDPKPLFYEFSEEVPAFDADGYAVEQRGDDEFVAELPKEGSA